MLFGSDEYSRFFVHGNRQVEGKKARLENIGGDASSDRRFWRSDGLHAWHVSVPAQDETLVLSLWHSGHAGGTYFDRAPLMEGTGAGDIALKGGGAFSGDLPRRFLVSRRIRGVCQTATITPPSFAYMELTPAVFKILTSLNFERASSSLLIRSALSGQLQWEI